MFVGECARVNFTALGVRRLTFIEFRGDVSYCRTMGSLYSGAFDSLTQGVRAAFPYAIELWFCAESDAKKAVVLARSSAPLAIFPAADDGRIVEEYPIDLLVASPPCVELAACRRARGKSPLARGIAAVYAHWQSLRSFLCGWSPPFLCLIEQSSGLVTHHRHAFALFRGWLRSAPYAIHCSVRDPCFLDGTSHHRARLLFVLVRLDCLAEPAVDAALGETSYLFFSPHFGRCERCRAPLISSGLCCRASCP